ncbi:MAG TPA: YhjD/YihY/BrkB family envelope integrity protein, partial [Bacillota bacterium]|nr:YhjD/YihY/BrkB family envelope integrity protein [Bacillota bacterium]
MKKSRVISVRSIKQMIKAASDTIREDRIGIYAASASFFLIISFIPFIMILVTTAGLVLSDNDVKQIERLISLLPEAPAKFIGDELQFLIDQKPAVPLSLTALALLWTASRGMLA